MNWRLLEKIQRPDHQNQTKVEEKSAGSSDKRQTAGSHLTELIQLESVSRDAALLDGMKALLQHHSKEPWGFVPSGSVIGRLRQARFKVRLFSPAQ